MSTIFDPVNVNTLVDSPLMRNVAKNHETRTGHKAKIRIEVFQDSELWTFICCKSE